jgi:phosphoserine aminotransferase
MRSRRVFNYGAGPAMLPAAIMQQAREEFLDWHGTGMSVVEMSHRGTAFMSIAEQAEADLRTLLGVPSDYCVLFLQGGATSQFGMVPLNLAPGGASADYLCTGHWSAKAAQEAQRLCKVNLVCGAGDQPLRAVPPPHSWQRSAGAAYLYYTENETIGGIEFHSVPDAGGTPLVCDMTSSLLSHPLDVSRFGIIFASAQKNFGPSGLVLVIARRDLLGRAPKNMPSLLDYAVHDKNGSMLNTPPTFSWYMAGLAFRWIAAEGGLGEMERRALSRSGLIYSCIDAGDFYRNPVDPAFRSRMNVPFTIADDSLHDKFLDEARAEGLVDLKGHRAVGGLRASLYNGMPQEGAEVLVQFMQEFQRRHG